MLDNFNMEEYLKVIRVDDIVDKSDIDENDKESLELANNLWR